MIKRVSLFRNFSNKIVCFIDDPKILDASVTNIPGSASPPVQVVASLTDNISTLLIFDGIGRYVGVYSGGVGSEALICMTGGGQSLSFDQFIKKGTRISLRNMESDAITRGSLTIMFAANNL